MIGAYLYINEYVHVINVDYRERNIYKGRSTTNNISQIFYKISWNWFDGGKNLTSFLRDRIFSCEINFTK